MPPWTDQTPYGSINDIRTEIHVSNIEPWRELVKDFGIYPYIIVDICALSSRETLAKPLFRSKSLGASVTEDRFGRRLQFGTQPIVLQESHTIIQLSAFVHLTGGLLLANKLRGHSASSEDTDEDWWDEQSPSQVGSEVGTAGVPEKPLFTELMECLYWDQLSNEEETAWIQAARWVTTNQGDN